MRRIRYNEMWISTLLTHELYLRMNIFSEDSTLFLANPSAIRNFQGNSLRLPFLPKSCFRKYVHRSRSRRVKARVSDTSELTYVRIRWITSSRTSCWVLRRGVSASSQMLLKRHCLPSCQPCLKSQHWILLCRTVVYISLVRRVPPVVLAILSYSNFMSR